MLFDNNKQKEKKERDYNDISCLSKEQLRRLNEGEHIGAYGEQIIMLHFRKFHERRGIGHLITAAGHMAMTVTDIGTSAHFYADVLGLPQIERPNFDRHGAWFTVGNLELHLIKGQAWVPTGEDLIVPHLAIETEDVDACIDKFRAMDPPVHFQLNVSVSTADGRGVVKQIFLRDPDGYYIEIG